MMDAQAALARGFAAYKQGDLSTARTLLEPISHPQAWHLLGLVERASGKHDRAADWLAKAAKADPNNPEIANNQGRLAFDIGELDAAAQHFLRALQLRPNWHPALTGLGRCLTGQQRWVEALPIWSATVRVKPNDSYARYNFAMALLEAGHIEDSEQQFDDLIQAGLTDPAVYFMRGRARVSLSKLEDAIADFRLSWNQHKTADTLRNLANTLWMSGDKEGFQHLISEAPDDFGATKLFLLAKAGETETALQLWNDMSEFHQNHPETLTAKSNIHRERGEGVEALEAAQKAHVIEAGQAGIDDALVSAQLMSGDHAGALRTLAPWRASTPYVQSWIAHEATALRLAGAEEYEWLVQSDNFVRAYELPTPTGFESIEQFNEALITAINPSQSLTQHPLDQTLRSGTQTVRDLVHHPDPVIKAYLAALDGPICSYLQAIGQSPDHPLTQRNTGRYRFNGCWSVTLKGGGRHVNHVHPKGWISSAYYARVPEENPEAEDKAGWIKFGEPPFETKPKLGPEKWVQPKAGMLVLFPSYMWHGTAPIHEGAERVTVPFDIVPVLVKSDIGFLVQHKAE